MEGIASVDLFVVPTIAFQQLFVEAGQEREILHAEMAWCAGAAMGIADRLRVVWLF